MVGNWQANMAKIAKCSAATTKNSSSKNAKDAHSIPGKSKF